MILQVIISFYISEMICDTAGSILFLVIPYRRF